MEDFELIEYAVLVTYDDYSHKIFIVPSDKVTSLEDIPDYITPEITKLENGDSKYYVVAKEVFKINNDKYLKFANDITSYFEEKELKYDFPVIAGAEIDFDIDTPEQKVPLKYKLSKEISELDYIDCNGRVVYSNVQKGIELLSKLSTTR